MTERPISADDESVQLDADIDATGEIENAMVDAARRLVEDHDYSLSDLLNLLEATLDLEP
jgi:hypothetical protein